MAEREILKKPHPILSKRAKSVSKVDSETKKLIDDMIDTMRSVNGLGLAANQVGVLQKIFVYDDGNGLGVMINPEIISFSGEQIDVEGCLSVPGKQGDVKRANEIVVKGMNAKGKPIKIKAEGLLARIFQHEIDHLQGKLFIDRVEPGSLYDLEEMEPDDSDL